MKYDLVFEDVKYPTVIDKIHVFDKFHSRGVNYPQLLTHLQEARALLAPVHYTDCTKLSTAWLRLIAAHRTLRDLIDAIENGEN